MQLSLAFGFTTLLAGAALSAHAGAGTPASCAGGACRARALQRDADGDASVHLLQRSGGGGGQALPRQPAGEQALAATDPESQRRRLQEALPLAWLHVPKCGSSLNNLLIHLPGVCPGVPDDTVISSKTFGPRHNEVFKKEYRVLDEDGACHGALATWGNHQGAGDLWDARYRGHAIVMLRQPEQRILSGYHFGWHSWPRHLPPANEYEYALGVQGCAVRMISRGGGPEPEESCAGGDPPSVEEVRLAITRVRTGCAFVGITDQWPLSMCLARRKFGGRCRLSDFVDGRVTDREGPIASSRERPTVHVGAPEPYDVSPLHGWTDPYDGALYEAALEVFRAELLRFNVSKESCRPCFEEAGVELDA